MNRKLTSKNVIVDNLECVEDEAGNIIVFRCMSCNKFVSKKHKYFYCPHCEVSFLDNVDTKNVKGMENLLNYLHDIKVLIGDV